MDAYNPLRSAALSAAFLFVVGCGMLDKPSEPGYTRPVAEVRTENAAKYAASQGGTVARPQAPADVPPLPKPADPPPGVTQTSLSSTPTKPSAATAALAAEADARVRVVAVIGTGNLVTDAEVWEAVRQRLGEYVKLSPAAQEAKKQEMYRAELKRIVERELLLDEMFHKLKKNGKPGVIEEIREFAGKAADQRVREYRKMFGAKTNEQFQEILTVQGLTEPVIRRQLERQVMADEYVRSMTKEKKNRIGLGDVRDYYDKHPDDFRTPDRVKWLDLFIDVSRFPTRDAAYKYADAIQKNAAAGHDFVALVRTYDHGDAVTRNGFGYGTARGEIRPFDLEEHVWKYQPGQVGPLIETPGGFHIIKIAEREFAGVRPYDEKTQAVIREKLNREFIDAERQKIVDDLWRKGVVRIIDQP